MKRALTLLFVVTMAASAFAQTPRHSGPWGESITVSGTGRSTVTPDRFTFTVGVQTVGQTVDQAVNENNARVAAVVAALKRAGAKDTEIRTSNFAIWPQQDYTQGKLPRILGYQVSNTVAVTKSEVAEAGKLLQVAVNAGVNQSSGLQFEVSDPARGRGEGMTAAFQDAKAKATLLAAAAGRSLGRALTINEGGQSAPTPYPMPRMAMRAESAQAVSDIPVESGSQDMTYSVTVTFELR
ncbi:MAG TPA: SIMPL domain-containing protein [Thermoanaerobaculia bacterium]|nr:SIMPL domain-containing protein [Thermoanaerobaculia bacterium]